MVSRIGSSSLVIEAGSIQRLNGTLLRSVFVAAIGGSLLGFDTAVISGATHSLTAVFHLSPAQLGFTVSAALWGTVAGAMAAGGLERRLHCGHPGRGAAPNAIPASHPTGELTIGSAPPADVRTSLPGVLAMLLAGAVSVALAVRQLRSGPSHRPAPPPDP
jgi:MFS family permease